MIRTQAQLTEAQLKTLKEMASERDVSVAELIRRGVDMVIEARERPGSDERRRRALAVVGAFSDDATDVARRHDNYFAGAIEEHR